MQIYSDRSSGLFRKQSDVAFLFAEADDLPVLASPVRAGNRAFIDRFQKIRLSLRVVAEDHIRSGIEYDLDALVIPVIGQFK